MRFTALFQNHIPVRGRKHVVHRVESIVHVIISKPYPRKGTETAAQRQTLRPPCSYFKTISPQGDGNVFSPVSRNGTTRLFQNHIPVRGRKPILKSLVRRNIPFISKPYPRKGTERISSLPCQSGGGGTRSVPEGAPWTQAVNLHSDRSARKAQAPPSARMLATSPVATGEAKQEEPRKGTETAHARYKARL